MKLGVCGEFGLIERIRARAAADVRVVTGIGDDCSVYAPPAGELLLTTTDLLIEGVHFRRDWTSMRDLGEKCIAVNISDIAAMGGTPRQISLGLGLPDDLEVADFDDLISGVLDGCAGYAVPLTGGDTCRSPGSLFVSVTVQGSAPAEEIVRRSGARPGDQLYVSGTLGDSALALRELLAGRRPAAALAGRHHAPKARLHLGRLLAQSRLVSAMIDISDGLLADLGHILTASGVGAEIDPVAIPLSPLLQAAVQADADIMGCALSGGEDYELLFAVPAAAAPALDGISAAAGVAVTRIGVVTLDAGLRLRTAGGAVTAVAAGGYNHFAGTVGS